MTRQEGMSCTAKEAVSADTQRPWEGSPMLLLTSTIDARKTGDLAEKMTAIEMTSASLIIPLEEMQGLRRLGFSVFQTDLDQMGTNEVEEGVWDWSVPDTHLEACRRAGGMWSLAAHFHVPPPWFADTHEFAPLRCLEHGAPFPGWSIWHSGAVAFRRAGCRALRERYGDDLYALWVGIHGDYGENEYPAGYRVCHAGERREWGERFGDAHDHEGWWCGDELARADFRKRMVDKYGCVEALNAAWGTSFVSGEEITYPASPGQRRYWLDFTRWYHDSMTRFSVAVTKVAQEELPGVRLFWLLGGPYEDPRLGQDQSALARAAAETGIEIRSSHGGHTTFATNYATMFKRIGSACKSYGVPFWSEPPYTIDAAGNVARIFEAVSCGAVAYYDWAWNPLEAPVRRTYERFGCYLTQEKPVVDVALLYPETHHLLNTDEDPNVRGYPQRFQEAASQLREVFDFDIVDERMIADGALGPYRVLVFLEGDVIEASTLESIAAWARSGGVAVTYDLGRVETVEGDRGPWLELFGIDGEIRPGQQSGPMEWKEPGFLKHLSGWKGPVTDQVCSGVAAGARVLACAAKEAAVWANPLAEGWGIMFAGSWQQSRVYYELLRDVVYNLSALDEGKGDAVAAGDSWDGVYSTLFEGGKILFYNPTGEKKDVDVSGVTVSLEPESLGHVFL